MSIEVAIPIRLNRKTYAKHFSSSRIIIALFNTRGLLTEMFWDVSGNSYSNLSATIHWCLYMHASACIYVSVNANPGYLIAKNSRSMVIEILHRVVRHFVIQKVMKPSGKPQPEQL